MANTEEGRLSPASPQTITADGIDNPEFMKGLEAAAAKDDATVQPETAQPAPTKVAKQPSKLSSGIRTLTGKDLGTAKPDRASVDSGGSADAPGKANEPDKGASASTQDDYKRGATTADDWKRIKTAERQAIERALKAEQALELARSEGGKAFKTEADRLRQENEKLLAEIEKTNIERSPRFNAEFEKKTGAILGRLRGVVPPTEMSKVEGLIRAPNSDSRITALEEIMNGLSPLKQRTFADIVSGYDTVTDERQFQIQQAFETAQAEAGTREQTQRAAAAERLQKFDSESSRWRDSLTSDNPEFNSSVEEGLARAKMFATSELPAEQQVQRDHWAGMGPVFAEMVDKLTQRVSELEGQLKAVDKSAADFSQDAGSAGEGSEDPSKEIARHGGVGEALMAGARSRGIL